MTCKGDMQTAVVIGVRKMRTYPGMTMPLRKRENRKPGRRKI